MFTPNFFIDTIQSVKRTMTNLVIQDKVLNKIAHNYIDAQTQFAKMMADNTIAVTQHAVEQFSNKLFSKV